MKFSSILIYLLGNLAETLRVPEEAMQAYEKALQHNPNSTAAMNCIGMLLKGREAFDKALEFFRTIVQIEPNNGEAWGNLGTLAGDSSMHGLQTNAGHRPLLPHD